jgi:hypothetical protein
MAQTQQAARTLTSIDVEPGRSGEYTAPRDKRDGTSLGRLIGWAASPDPFRLVPVGHAKQFQASIESISARAMELSRTQKWQSAEDHLHSAIWLAIADGDVAWCVEVGLKLVELYLALNELDSVRALAEQLLPLASTHGLEQHALGLYTALAITPMLYSPGHAGIDASQASCAELRRHLNAALIAEIDTQRFDRVLYQNVATLLIAASDEFRLHAWNWSWDQLGGEKFGRPRLGG